MGGSGGPKRWTLRLVAALAIGQVPCQNPSGRRVRGRGVVTRAATRGRLSVLHRAGIALAFALAASSMPTPAAADPVDVPPWTCAGAAVTDEEIEAFVALWAPRVQDQAFLDDYLALDDFPQDILDEGFHGLPEVDKQCLVSALYAQLAADVPGFGADLTTDVVHAFLYLWVFDKSFADAVAGEDGSGLPTPPNVEAPVGALDTLLNSLKVPDVNDLPLSVIPSSLQPPALITQTADQLLGALDPGLLPPLFTDPGGFIDLPPLPFPPLPTITPPVIDLEALILTGRSLLDSGTYRVCHENPSKPGLDAQCSIDVPLGTPVPRSVDGDLISDVLATLSPSIDPAFPGGFTFQWNVRKLKAGKVPTHVFAIFEPPNAFRQMKIGFASRDTLAVNSTARFTVKDIQRALNGDVDLRMSLTNQQPGTSLVTTFGTAQLIYSESPTGQAEPFDPIGAGLAMTPVPASFVTDARINTSVPNRDQYTVNIQSSVPTQLYLPISTFNTLEGSRKDFFGLVDKLPTTTNVDILDEGGKITANYNASAPINTFGVASRAYPVRTDLTTFEETQVIVKGVPTQIAAVVTPPLQVDLTMSAPVTSAEAQVRTVVTNVVQQRFAGQALQVPSEIHLLGSVDAAGDNVTADVTYRANANLGKLAFQMFDRAKNNATLDATITSVPRFIRAVVDKQAHDTTIDFDARSAPEAAPGSAGVGPIVVNYAANAAFLANTPADDHLVLKETGSTLQAHLQYTGLARARFVNHDDVSAADNDTIQALLGNTESRLFLIQADTQNVLLDARIDKLPQTMQLDYERLNDAHLIDYEASSGITSVQASALRKSTGEFLNAKVEGVPSSVHLTADLPNKSVVYSASSPVTKVEAAARTLKDGRTLDSTATVTGVPTNWDLSYNPDNARFRAGTDAVPMSIGSIKGTFTNHGAAIVPEAGQHAVLTLTGAGDLDASLAINALASFSYTKLANGFTAAATAGDGSPFHALANVTSNGKLIKADVVLSALPRPITITQEGEHLSYTGGGLYDLTADVEIRPVGGAAAENPPTVRGLALRDGPNGALKLKVFMEGAPTSLDADMSTTSFGFGGYKPPAADPTLNADIVLDDGASPLSTKVRLEGIPASAAGYGMGFGPIVIGDEGPDRKGIHADTTATLAGAGPLTVDLNTGAGAERKTAQIVLSNVPTFVDINGVIEPETFTFTGGLGEVIDSLKAFYKEGSAANWQVVAELTDVPTSFSFLQEGLTSADVVDPCAEVEKKFPVPRVVYTANSDDLDINVGTDPSLFGGGIAIAIKAGITNLGRVTTFTFDGTTLNITSTPDTDLIEVHVGGEIRIVKDFDEPDPCESPGDDAISVSITGDLDLRLPIEDFMLKIVGLTSMVITPGISTGFQGDFTSFEFGWDRVGLDLTLDLGLEICVDLGIEGCVDIPIVSIDELMFDINILFHTFKQEQEVWTGIPTPIPCDISIDDIDFYHLDLEILPAPVSKTWNGISLGNPASVGGAWVVTPDPFDLFPDIVVEAVTALFTSPFDSGFSPEVNCR